MQAKAEQENTSDGTRFRAALAEDPGQQRCRMAHQSITSGY